MVKASAASPANKPFGDRAFTEAERAARWRIKDPQRAKLNGLRAKEKMRARVADYKTERGCESCEIIDSRVLDLHHRNGDEKVMAVSQMMYRFGWQAVREEMSKCRVLCANCHRIEHSETATTQMRAA